MFANDRIALRLASLAAVLVLFAPGCKKAGHDTSAPSDEGGASADAVSDPLGELDALEGRMRDLGLPVAQSKRSEFAQPPPDDSAGGDAEGEAVEVLGEDEAAPAEAPAQPEPMDASPGAGPSRDRERATSKCDDVCSLNEAICELEVRICEMSETHDGDPTYAEACERAIEDCATSGDACDACHG